MGDFSGRRALLVEDEGAVALLIEDMLAELGFDVVASVARLSEACKVASMEALDFALLDVNLSGEFVFPVARILSQRRIPFLFSTGYGGAGIPEEFRHCSAIAKPFTILQLQETIQSVIALEL
jgi:CheY-like chemotaxis protein